MAYTIKGLAKANECKTLDAKGLADVWDYWYVCNCGGRNNLLVDFKSLRKSDRKEMLDYLYLENWNLYRYITENII